MMTPFIAKQIEKAGKISIEKGQAKYRAYFIKTNMYEEFREDVETILRTDGFEECIVEK